MLHSKLPMKDSGVFRILFQFIKDYSFTVQNTLTQMVNTLERKNQMSLISCDIVLQTEKCQISSSCTRAGNLFQIPENNSNKPALVFR